MKPGMKKLILNKLKVVLAEKSKSNRWLAEKLKINENTVSKWVNTAQQPPLLTFYKISVLLEVDLKDLFESTLSKK
jgi:putative transcriptional regulator